MHIFLPILITFFILVIVVRILLFFKEKIKFYATGLDSGFKVKEIGLLWSLAQVTKLEEPCSLYWSLSILNKCISLIVSKYQGEGSLQNSENQAFLTRLYDYRTQIELSPRSKGGLKSSRSILVGQKLRIVLPGTGVYASTVVNNSRHFIISLPLKNNIVQMSGSDWIGKSVSVYFMRKDDAGYVFDSVVQEASVFNGKPVLHLAHSDDLLRTQKRRSVRCNCAIYAQVFVIGTIGLGNLNPETKKGLKCLVEDISEKGALIRIGGKAVKNMHMKLQFPLGNDIVVMNGVVKSVTFLQDKNQSQMHFECLNIDERIKNMVLTYVYNVLPREQMESHEAITLAETDSANS
ncbi:MAG: PilZ domain-containing protein [Spirochaetaceae bacterium]|nr:PilZ domain-containing protein [Spirochaetaceae bacterium]